MELNEIEERLDIYEVEKGDYESYFFRLPQNDLMKTTPREGWTLYKDVITQSYVCGVVIENIMGMDCSRFFIFEFLPEERLGKELTVKQVCLSEEDFIKFVEGLTHGKDSATSR